jgi:hypothetical protein
MKLKIEIKSWLSGVVLFEFEKENNTVKDTVIEANLRGANLYGANLYGADLYGANLYGANLRGADLYGANLYGANLRGANLYGANLREANLYGADLRGADLYGADLYGANLYGADLRGADLRGANLREADLRGANLYGANLRGANLRGANLYETDLGQLPKDYINQCSRDILSIFSYLKKEVPFLKKMLIEGKVDGSQYEGECACLIGTLANGNGGLEQVCGAIPFYEKGTHNYGEMFFLNIRKGDTPETNQFSAHVLKLIEMFETGKFYTIFYEPTKEELKKMETRRKELLK